MFVKPVLFNLVLLIFLLSCAGVKNQLQNNEDQKLERVCNTIAVMPFIINESYPYNSDVIRRDVELAFFRLDCEIVAPYEWDYSLIDSINLVNPNIADCDSISRILNVDLLITGDFNFNVQSQRVRGLGRSITIYKPLILKAYNSKLKDFVLVKRDRIIERWGLFGSSGDDYIYKLSDRFARVLVNMGFLKN